MQYSQPRRCPQAHRSANFRDAPPKVLRASPHFEVNWNTAAADRFAAAGVTLGVGAPLRIAAKTAAAGQELDPGEPVLPHEALLPRKGPPLSTKQHLAAALDA